MNFWNTFFGAIEPTVKYCETAITGIIARPGYFVSNIPFIILGVWLIFKKDKLSKIFGAFSILIGVASGIYDASFRYTAQLIDLNVMFAFVNFLLILNLHKLFSFTRTHKIRLFLEIQALYLILLLLLKGGVGSLIFGLAVFGVIVTQVIIWRRRLDRTGKWNWIAAFSLFLVGWIIWQLDANQIWCDPSNLFNGRALFHYFVTGSIYFLWKHYSNGSKASKSSSLSK